MTSYFQLQDMHTSCTTCLPTRRVGSMHMYEQRTSTVNCESPSAETQAGWSHLICHHNFVTVGCD